MSRLSKSNDLLLAACVFVFLSAVYLLTMSGNMQITSDEGVNLALVESLAKFGRFDVEQMATLTRAVPAEHGPDGLHYSKYGLAQAVLSLPFYRLAQAVESIGVVHTLLLFNAFVTAATGAFVYLLARQLGYGAGLARGAAPVGLAHGAAPVGLGLGLALLYGLASPAWVYTKRYMSEPLSSLALASAAYCALRALARGAAPVGLGGHALWAVLAGLCLGVGVMNKTANAAFAPVFFAFLLLGDGPGDRPWAARLRWRRGWWRSLAFLLPVALALAATGYYNWVRFGDILHTGYGPNEGFSVPIWEGLAGLLFSPGKSQFIYFPLLLLLPFWAPAFVRRQPAVGLFFLGLVVGHVLLYATWWIWWGGWNWGVRFLVPAWAFAVLLLGEGLWGLRRPSGAGWAGIAAFAALAHRAAPVGLVAASVVVQVLGVAVDHTVFIASLLPLSLDPDRLTLADPARQPILNQLRYLQPRFLDFGWMTADKQPPFDVPSLGWLSAGVLASLAALGTAYRRPGRGALALAALAVAVLVVGNGALTYLERTYEREDRSARAIVAHLREQAGPRATLIYLAPRFATLWANAATFAIPTWGQHEEAELQPSTRARLERLVAEYDEIWVISENPPGAPESGIERWVAAHGFRQSERWYGPFRLASYRTGRADAAGFVPLAARFGRAIELTGYTVDEPSRPRRPGETVNVTLRWRALARPDRDYTVFVHLLDEREQVTGQQDVQPGGGFAPTGGWQPGEALDDRYAVPILADAPAGSHRIEVGLYLPESGERLPVLDASGAELGNRIILPTGIQIVR